ncbi:MAG TPA: chemotaxis response regulator protein-glutamate methylesterase [Alphaproteobacteria bacterium]|nr:chemotaxis response regulator protein-glutamate methylesterase [Alphaproteobacteria bacterium]
MDMGPIAARAAPPTPVCRVMVVDDSSLMRGLMMNYLYRAEGCEVVAVATNGAEAVEKLKHQPVDVIILDIEMPVMDGLSAIAPLKAVDRSVQIVMASTLTQRNAAISLRALALGASDYIPKPTAAEHSAEGGSGFRHMLLEKVRELGKVAHTHVLRAPLQQKVPAAAVKLRPMPVEKPEIIAIASSTGGPQALINLIAKLGKHLPPVVITQHMPPFFTTSLAQNIAAQCGVICAEAVDGEVLKYGHYYIAPGDFHLTVSGHSGNAVASLNKEQPENFCRPSANPMLRSIAAVYGKNALALVLTGMGQDGCTGCDAIVKAGGAVFAQDEATSVVWGMPGAVANAGLCSAVMPLEDMARSVLKLAGV